MTEGYRQIQQRERAGGRGRNEEKEGGRRMGRGRVGREGVRGEGGKRKMREW